MVIKKGDFVQVEYTGRIKGEGVFDTNIESAAKDNNIYNEKITYKPVVVVVGENHLLKGIDENLEGKEIGEYTFDIPPEKGFGKKAPQLLRLVPSKIFKEQNIQPFVGLEVDVDGVRGTVRTVSGGRIIVDFNHPLASKDLEYKVKVLKIITDPKEKLEGLADLLGVKTTQISLQDGKAAVSYDKTVTDPAKKLFAEQAEKLAGVKVEEAKETEKKTEQETKTETTTKPAEKPESATEKTETNP